MKFEANPVNTLKSEHLKNGERPIMACFASGDEYDDLEFRELSSSLRKEYWKNAKEIYFYSSKINELSDKNFKHAGEMTYIISPIDSENKYSTGFKNCTGIVVSGKDKKTGEYISFMSHQSPDSFLRDKKDNFIKDLKEILEEIKLRSEEGTIDAVIAGGKYKIDNDYDFKKQYVESINLLGKQIEEQLGFNPVVISGPKNSNVDEGLYYDNKNKRLHILVRPQKLEENGRNNSFMAKDIEKQKDNWDKLL